MDGGNHGSSTFGRKILSQGLKEEQILLRSPITSFTIWLTIKSILCTISIKPELAREMPIHSLGNSQSITIQPHELSKRRPSNKKLLSMLDQIQSLNRRRSRLKLTHREREQIVYETSRKMMKTTLLVLIRRELSSATRIHSQSQLIMMKKK
jgi:hypothetical protein